jgi:DNA polymerase-4
VRAGARRGSFGSQCAVGSGIDPERADALLLALVDRVTRRMRAKASAGRTVTLRLRFRDFSRATRSHTLPRPTAGTRAVLTTARRLLADATPMIEGLELPIDRATALDLVLDDVRDRFGPEGIRRAVLLDHGPRLATWLFPGEEP